ncbi:MAG TPA: acyl-CoA dehydrogenase family protein [Pedococcus sp.]
MNWPTTVPLPEPLDLPADPAWEGDDPLALAHAVRHLACQRDWTALRWPELVTALESLGRTDIPLSRLTEGHVDALRIHAEAGTTPSAGCLYGVWASRSRGTGIRARRTDGGWHLEGTLRFASGAGLLDRALLPVWTDDETSVLLDVPVGDWPVDDSAWQTSAMRLSHSHTIHLDHDVPGDTVTQVGGEGFYLGRAGFFPGGIGVAAVWVGGAARVADLVRQHVGQMLASPAAQLRLGHLRTDLVAAAGAVEAAATRLAEGGVADPGGLQALATETRAVVGTSVQRLLEQARAIAGPAGLAFDGPLTRAIDDLDLYVRQQNTDGDALFLGGLGGGPRGGPGSGPGGGLR